MDGRESNGQWAKGNPGGPGRPPRTTEDDYLNGLTDAVPLDTWRAICERAAVDATAGDAKARDWLAKYLLPIRREAAAADFLAELYADPLEIHGEDAKME